MWIYKINNTTKIINKTTVYQLERYTVAGKFVSVCGWVDKISNIPQATNTRIGRDCVIINTKVPAESMLGDNVVLLNSVLGGPFIIDNGSHIENSNIVAARIGLIKRNTVIRNKTIKCFAALDNDITNTPYFYTFSYAGDQGIISQTHLCMGCYKVSLTELWQILNNDRLWADLPNKFTKANPQLFTPEARQLYINMYKQHEPYIKYEKGDS